MAGVFARTNEVNNHPKRNTYPLSFQNSLSGKFGVLYPCLVQDVIPGFGRFDSKVLGMKKEVSSRGPKNEFSVCGF